MALQEKSICFISPFMGPLLAKGVSCGTGGAERQFYLFGKELAKRGWRVVFIADCPVPSDTQPENVSVLHVPFKHMGGRKVQMLLELPKLLFAMWRARTRFYAIKTAPHLAGVVCAYKTLFPCHLIMWGQTSTSFDRLVVNEPRCIRWIRWRGVWSASLLIAQTKEQAEHAQVGFGKQAIVVPNITSVPAQASKRSTEKGYVLWCGSHLKNKRAEIFLELAIAMPEQKFIMAMNGDERAERYRTLRDSAKRVNNIQFLGSVSQTEIDSWFEGASVYINTSIQEGFPNTFLQCWQHGHPVLTVNIDPERNIEEEHLGFCLYSDEQHLCESPIVIAKKLRVVLTALLNDNDALRQYSLTCRDYIERVHSEYVVVNKFVDSVNSIG